PQAVVDGEYHTVGNNHGRVFGLIRKAAGAPKPVTLNISAKGDSVTVESHGSASGSAKVWLAITEDDLSTDVKAGENRSKTLHHNAVVREIESIGKIKEGTFSRTVPLKLKNDWQRDKLHAVAFIQDSHGRVLGAGT